MAPCGREAHQLALCAGLPRMEYEWLHDGQSGTLRGRLLFWRINGWLIALAFFCGNPRSRRCAIGIVLEVFLWNIHSALLLLMWAERKLRVPSCVMKTSTLHPSFFRSARFLPMRSRVGKSCLLAFSTLSMTCVPRLFLMAKPSWALALRRLVVLT